MLKFLSNLLFPQKIEEIFQKIKDFLSGKKTYIAASVLLLNGLITAIDQITGMGSIAEILNWITNFQDNQVWTLFAQALAIFGVRAAISKK